MKKLMLSLLLFILLPSVVLASSKTVSFNVSFEDASFMDSIDKIYVNYTDKSETEYSVTLEKTDNYFYTYNEYDGTDIEKVSVSFDNPTFKGTSSVIKGTNEYNISINIEKDNNEEIFIGGSTQSTTTTTTTTTTTNTTTTSNVLTTTALTTTKNNMIETGLSESQVKSNKVIKTIFMTFAIIALIIVVIFALQAIIKIVNANK